MSRQGCVSNPCILLYMPIPPQPWLFRAEGWQVVETRDLIEVLRVVKSREIDLAILQMPLDESIDTDLPNVLRSISPTAYLPVIVITTEAAEAQRCRFFDSGADDVIPEQTSVAQILARIKTMLRIKGLHDQLSASREALQQALEREHRLVTRMHHDNEALRVLCTTDPLTHVQNVRSFGEIIDHEFKTAKRYGNTLSSLMLDIDHFKMVNDTHGHPSGDYVLKELAVILMQSVRESDVVARAGGEEFGILLPNSDARQSRKLAERIRKHVCNRKFVVHAQMIHITVSIGIATFPADAEIGDPSMLRYCADQALLVAKETGRDRVVAFSDLPQPARVRLRQQYLAAWWPGSENRQGVADEQLALGPQT